MADVNDLYPKAPTPTPGLLSDPSKILGLIGQANQNALFQQTFGARKAIGEAYQNAIQPDGSIDTPTLMREIKSRPDAGFMAGEASGGALTRQGQQIQNATALFEQQAKQNQFVVNGLGSLADKPNPTMEDVRHFVVTAARNTGIPAQMLTSWASTLPRDPAKLKDALVTFRNLATGSAGLSAAAPGGITPEGAPLVIPQGQFNYKAAGANGPAAPAGAPARPAGIQTALSPSAAAAAPIVGAASASAGVRLREAADMGPQAKAMLGNLEEDMKKFTSGPAADWTRVGKAWTNRNVPLPKDWKFDPESIASQEQFNKQALQLAQQQFATIGGTGTDAKFSSAFETNPHETLSHLGNEGIIRMLKGNQDAITAKNKAWLNWKSHYGADSYDEFSADFNRRFDPRTFQFRYMTKPQRQQYVDRMDKNDRGKFLEDLTDAHKQGWIAFEKPKE